MSETGKVVVINYNVQEIFKIPINIDLENKEQVEEWYVKNNMLRIILVDNKNHEIVIMPEGWVDSFNYKTPNVEYSDDNIENGSDYGLDDNDFEVYNSNTQETVSR